MFTHAPIQTRAPPLTQNRRKQVERGNIRIRDLGNVPSERKPCQLGREFVMHFATAELRRFFRNKNRLKRFLRVPFEKVRQLLVHFFAIDISHHDEGEIVRHVTRFVILHHLLLRELIVNFYLADHREPIGMALIRGREEEQARLTIRVVKAHCELAANDLLLFCVFFRRESRIHHRVGQNRERGLDSILRHVDPKNCPIERSVGVDVTAHVLDFLRDRVARLRFGSLKQHVFEDVRETGAQFLVLVNAAGAAPRLHACHRRASVFLDDQRQAVGQDPFLRRTRRKSDDGGVTHSGSFQVHHAKDNRRN